MSVAAVEQARFWANELIRMESRGNGDLHNAMRRLGNRHGISWRVFWNLRYREQKDITVGVFEKLRAAHAEQCRRQIERLRNELQISERNGVDAQDIADQVEALAAQLETLVAKRKAG